MRSIRPRGSSPLTRGKLDVAQLLADGLRLIPTHAGKTPSRSPRLSLAGAHPHSRGENCSGSSRASISRGSSPLTRGKHRITEIPRVRAGLIPTHAGKTSASTDRTSQPRAHPHSRGENSPSRPWTIPGRGSSPLTRGKRKVEGLVGVADRLIPTHAGKTLTRFAVRRSSWAHPHSRGENTTGN